jgi:hypothetical protein
MSRLAWFSFALIVIILAAVVFTLWMRARFNARIDKLEAHLDQRAVSGTVRSDLPPEVMALALRLGADPASPARLVRMSQTGSMWQSPGSNPMEFTGKQMNSSSETDFVWRAVFPPLNGMDIVDFAVAGTAGLEGKLFGLYTVVHQPNSDELLQGELLRYLAELPWNPDAILTNRALDWRVMDAAAIEVSTKAGMKRAVLTLFVNKDGLVDRAFAEERGYATAGPNETRPWRGRFWDFRVVNGRTIPHQAEVAWVLDGKDFIYFRCLLTNWRIDP